ncbi:protein-disulfide isomerase [Oleispira antarctica]|uniref:Thiol:disulfide interchange protein n=1 Tax=Oleispira antarctica TaxID=188908 RepID=A0A1Y5HU95_OLEAN|nr:protein-disulfide isomerase [Oleispira antarctica]
MRIILLLGAVIGSLMALTSQAEESVEETISKALRAAQPNLILQSATQVADQALYEVELTSGQVLYSTPDGKYFVYGSLFEAGDNQLVDLSAKRGDAKRQKLLAAVNVDDMVVFQSKGEQKAVVNVFTDVDCGYCRKLHREVPRLNELGITVRYLAYPRAGVYSDKKRTKFTGSYKKLKSVWCDSDRPAAMSKAKATGFIKENLNCDAPIEAQLALGEQFGVRGTPALIFETGELVPGYMPADELAKKLGL